MRITRIGGIVLLGILAAVLLVGDNISLGGFITTHALGFIFAGGAVIWVLLGVLANSRREREGGVHVRDEA